MIKTVFFDLDGTLLGMDEKQYIRLYMPLLYQAFDKEHYTFEEFARLIMKALQEMIADLSDTTDIESYFESFKKGFKGDAEAQFARFMKFYETTYELVKPSTFVQKSMVEAVKILKKKNYRLVIATNPIFPKIATQQRIKWAGLDLSDFELVTYQEEMHYCKPHLEYYQEIIKKLDLIPEEIMMVGNNVEEDMVAGKLGLKTYLVEDCLLDPQGKIDQCLLKGSAKDFLEYVKEVL